MSKDQEILKHPEYKLPKNGIWSSIIVEYNKAIQKHPGWPTDVIHASAIVAEESGELTRAALHHTYENGSLEAAKKEAIQTAVTAIRFLEELDRYE